MRCGLIIADRHHKADEQLHPSYVLVKKFAKTLLPDFVVDLGDTLDLEYFSNFDEGNVPEGDWEDDVDLVNSELDFWQSVTKEVHWLQGNHDERAERAAKKVKNYALKKTINYERRFSIQERGIKYYRITDSQPVKMGKLHFAHGWFWNKYHGYTHLDRFAGNIVYGHVHTFQVFSKFLQSRNEEIQSWSIGCLSDKQPNYVKGRPTGWQNGFAILYLRDDGNFNLYPINIIKNKFVWAGKEWK